MDLSCCTTSEVCVNLLPQRVLVIDGDAAIGLEARSQLQGDGFQVMVAENHDQCLETFNEFNPQLVLLGTCQSKGDGIELFDRLRRLPGGAHTPVVIITETNDHNEIDLAYQVGAADFVCKPIDWTMLRQRLRYVLRASDGAATLRRYQFIFDQDQEPVALLDASYAFQAVNGQYQAMFGRTADEIVGCTYRELHGQQAYEQLRPKLDDCLDGNNVGSQLWDTDGSGQQRHLDISFIPYRDGGGGVVGVVVCTRDTTERFRIEEQQRLRTVAVLGATDGVLISELRTDQQPIVYASPAFCRLTGYEQSELLGRDCRILQGKDTDRSTVAEMSTAIKARRPFQGEVLNYRKDGTEFWNLLRLEPLADADGAIRHYVGVQTDITARKLAEQRLRHFEVISSYTSDLMSLVSADYRYLAVNKAYVDHFQQPSEKIIDRSAAELHGQEMFEKNIKPLLDRCLSGETIHERHWIYPPLGDPRFIDVVQVPFRNPEGEIVAAVVTTRDITALKEAEQALMEERASLAQRVEERTTELSTANEELARAARMKDAFLASMSHELRTPLNAILGLSEALQEHVFGQLTDRQIEPLRTMEESGRHLLSLINDVLDVARVGAGELPLLPEEIDPEELCRASISLVKPAAVKKRLRISTQLDPSVASIRADRRRLKQILVNLLSNAVKFTPEEGQIGIEMDGDASLGVVRFCVWDNGIGITENDLQLLFQPFVQLDNGLSRQHDGTGLGLTLVYSMVQLHGGGVSVDSELGKGSRFTVTLPLQVDTSTGHEDDPDELAGNRYYTEPTPDDSESDGRTPVLLVEDNGASVKVVHDYLSAKGYRVPVARDGGEAIVQARRQDPALILMDVQMPGMDGLETIRRLRAEQQFSETPIIALTALAMPGDRERCLAAGANDYLSKPVALKKLAQRIGELLQPQCGTRHG